MTSQADPHQNKRFVILTGMVWAILSLLVFTTNVAMDPLWYYHGNLITGKNFAFDERGAKINRLMRDPSAYDCLILGSSRTTLLPATALSPYHCFNLAFSGGQIEEFIEFANYLRDIGIQPRLLVIGVDGFNFMEGKRDPPSIPDYIVRRQPPPGMLRTYLSIDSFFMSMRTLLEQRVRARYYNNQFDAVISTDAPIFRPQRSLDGEGQRRADAAERRKRRFKPDNAELFGKLATVFPSARTIAYVPPMSAWHVKAMQDNGTLETYLDALHVTASHFPVFMDFSIPSPITWQTNNTFDGSHYAPSVNADIARMVLGDEAPTWGINVKLVDRSAYHRRYYAALTEFAEN